MQRPRVAVPTVRDAGHTLPRGAGGTLILRRVRRPPRRPIWAIVMERGTGGRLQLVLRARVRARVAVRACSPPVALLQVKIFSCCFNTNMNSLQNFEYFEPKHVV